jgi:anti-anti-sigma factor
MNGDQEIKDSNNSPSPDREAVLMINIPGSLSVIESPSFRKVFDLICEAEIPPSRVTLDFSKTSFLDSTGIGALASIIKMSKINGINLAVSGITAQVYAVLIMTKLDCLLRIDISDVIDHESVIEAEFWPIKVGF